MSRIRIRVPYLSVGQIFQLDTRDNTHPAEGEEKIDIRLPIGQEGAPFSDDISLFFSDEREGIHLNSRKSCLLGTEGEQEAKQKNNTI